VSIYLLCWAGSSLLVYYIGKALWKLGLDFPIPRWHRFIFFGMLPMHLLLGMFLYDWTSGHFRSRKGVALIAILTVGVLATNILAIENLLGRESFVSDPVRELAGHLSPEQVVIADQQTSEILAGYYGFTTMAPILWEQNVSERNHDLGAFFDPTTPEEELRGITQRYSAGAIVLRMRTMSNMPIEGCEDLRKIYDRIFRQVFENDVFVLYEPEAEG